MYKTVLFFLLLALFSACKNPHIQPEEVSDDPHIRARELNDSALGLLQGNFRKHAPEAIRILDRSIALDTAYDKARLNKLAILAQGNLYSEALLEISSLERLRPGDPDLLVCKGILQEYAGDSLNAVFSYESAIQKYREWQASGDTLLPDAETCRIREACVWHLLKKEEKAAGLLRTVSNIQAVENVHETLKNRKKLLVFFWSAMVPQLSSGS
jgi:tetratricopeptide (TPR) repeat protein